MPAMPKKQRDLLNAARKATGRESLPSSTPKKKKKLSGAAKQAREEKKARVKAAKAPSPASNVKTRKVKQVRQLGGSAKQAKLSAAGKAIDKIQKGRGLPKVQHLPAPIAKPKPKTGTALVPAKSRALQVISQASKAAKSIPMPWPAKLAMWAGSAALPWLIGKGLSEGDKPRQMTKKNQRGQRVPVKRGIAGMPDDPTWSREASDPAVAPKQLNGNAGVKHSLNPNLPFRKGERKAMKKKYTPTGSEIYRRDRIATLSKSRSKARKELEKDMPSSISQGIANLFGAKYTPGHRDSSTGEMTTSPHAKYNPQTNPVRAVRERKKRKGKGWSNTVFPK